jgi:uncharacterized protein (TIGR02996 family)
MSDAAAFLRAIIAEPDADFPRLAYADWLDEHGQPERSEFIRVQVELAACWLCRGQPETQWRRCGSCRAHRRRELELLTANGASWAAAVADLLGFWNPTVGPPRPSIERNDGPLMFRRGFVSSVTLSWADWQAHAARLLESCPIRRVWRERACENCRAHGPGAFTGHNRCPACRGAFSRRRPPCVLPGGHVVLARGPRPRAD